MAWLRISRHDDSLGLACAALVVALALLLSSWNIWLALQQREVSAALLPTARSATIESREPATTVPSTTVAAQAQPQPQGRASSEYFTVSADEPALPAGDGLEISPNYGSNGRFQGYLVTGRSGDYRFSHGDIITAIGQTPVEDSAAGSELLLIALAQPDTALTTLRRQR
ncbi:MAG: hypothetical protein AB8B93_20950 [Pseudomonadales bacterium]